MVLFFVGLAILIFGGIIYSKVVESQFQPDDRETPAVRKADGVDYVTMSKKKNWLINLLNIAGTGPILGPIQGILFGPIAFLAIPLGCVFAGAVHDYATGMISMRNGGSQVPKLVGKYLGTNVKRFYNIVIAILLLLTGTVFVYTPGDLIANDIMGLDPNSNVIWIIYGTIFIYYILSTVLPIDKLIGRIYPLFGAFLLISSIGVFVGIIFKGLSNLQFDGYGLFYDKINYYLIESNENLGPWVRKSKLIGKTAKIIAKELNLDPDIAYACGSLLDIGKRENKKDLDQIITGFNILRNESYFFPARITITSKFIIKDIDLFDGKINIEKKDEKKLENLLKTYKYNDYDKLIQLLDKSILESYVGVENYYKDKIGDKYLEEKIKKLNQYQKYFEEKLKNPIKYYVDQNTR